MITYEIIDKKIDELIKSGENVTYEFNINFPAYIIGKIGIIRNIDRYECRILYFSVPDLTKKEFEMLYNKLSDHYRKQAFEQACKYLLGDL